MLSRRIVELEREVIEKTDDERSKAKCLVESARRELDQKDAEICEKDKSIVEIRRRLEKKSNDFDQLTDQLKIFKIQWVSPNF